MPRMMLHRHRRHALVRSVWHYRIGSALRISPSSVLTYRNPQASMVSVIANQYPFAETSSVRRHPATIDSPGDRLKGAGKAGAALASSS